jgi:hypothetical protein
VQHKKINRIFYITINRNDPDEQNIEMFGEQFATQVVTYDNLLNSNVAKVVSPDLENMNECVRTIFNILEKYY